MILLGILLLTVVPYFLGCSNGSILVSRFILRDDIRNHGSGNAGLTNFYRTFGGGLTFLVILTDVLKAVFSLLLGMLGAYLLRRCGIGAISPIRAKYIAGVFCELGHMFPVMFGFKGGKGIAVAIGCLFVTFGVVPSIIELLIFIVLVVATRYVSVGSMAAALACPFLALWVFWGNWLAVLLCAITGLTVFWAHRGNLARLREGTERRVGDKKKQ